jgi:glycosyltransferase involved in cell wall biosynthesis
MIPHITEPIDLDDHHAPAERTFLQCGAYNLGFIGLADRPVTRRMLTWWQVRCEAFCVSRPREGLFVDQKWMDLVPGLFGDVFVLRDPTLNVAYWNLHGRTITLEPEPTVNGRPMGFFHFSGYDPEAPDVVSKHQTRFRMKDLGVTRELFSLYGDRLLAEGYREVSRWPYSYREFDNGIAIAPIVRDLYYRLGPEAGIFGNPFSTRHPGSFYDWLNAPADGEGREVPYISNLMKHVPAYRHDVPAAFPDYQGSHREAFLGWLRFQGHRDLELSSRFLDPIDQGHSDFDDARMRLPGISRDLVRSFSDHSCRVCILLRLLDRWHSRARIRNAVAWLLSRPSKPGLPGTSKAGHPGNGRGTSQTFVLRSLPSKVLAPLIKTSLRPCPTHINLTRFLGPTPPTVRRLGRRSTRAGQAPAKIGVNLAGYFTTESGVGEAARLIARATRAAEIPHVLINFEQSYNLRRTDRTFTDFATSNPYGVNLVHVNADQIDVFAREQGDGFFAGKYNIGYWMWELSDFPSEWRDRFEYFDEIWVASTFAAESVGRASPIPVLRIPLPIVGDQGDVVGRDHFGLPSDAFIFLFMFDFLSVFERKNPLAVVEAYKEAFGEDNKAMLVLKCSNAKADPTNAAKLLEAAKGASIRVIDGYLSRMEVASLVSVCDTYVSLHRSEGFGLTMAEAMRAGKPVIATAYSANVDFMNAGNSFSVAYRLVEIEKDFGPYRRGSAWAEPNVKQAAELMRWVFEHREVAALVGSRAREDMTAHLSPAAVGKVMKDRLQIITG